MAHPPGYAAALPVPRESPAQRRRAPTPPPPASTQPARAVSHTSRPAIPATTLECVRLRPCCLLSYAISVFSAPVCSRRLVALKTPSPGNLSHESAILGPEQPEKNLMRDNKLARV